MEARSIVQDNGGDPMSTKEDLHIGAHEGVDPSDESLSQKLFSGLEVFADVGIKLGKSIDEHTEQLRKNSEMQRNTPVYSQSQVSGVFPSSGNLILDLGKPDRGTAWEVGQAVIGGTDLNVAAVGTAGLYVTGSTAATGGTTNAADYAASLPNVGFYGMHQLVVNSGEHLLAVIFGGTVGQVYVAEASFTVFNTSAGQGNVVIAS